MSIPWLLVGKVLTFFLYFAISIFIVRGLGPSQYGIYSLLAGMADYLMVFCTMGLNQSLLRFVPELTAHANRSGLKRFLINSTVMQGVALLVTAIGLYFFSPWLSKLFHMPFSVYVVALALFTAMLVSKEFLNNLFTSLFMARFLAITSVGQAIIFIIWLGILHYTDRYSVTNVLLAFSGSIAAMSCLSVLKLWRFFSRWKGSTPKPGIGRRRVLSLTLPMTFMAVTNKLLSQYSEIFFLGYFVAPALLGYYSLAFMLANALLTFVPMALQTLFTSAFSEAYARHEGSLGQLTTAVFQVLMVVTLPLGCFGAFFSPHAIELIYGSAMAPAGAIASFFCLFRILPMVWIPLSMALTATEQVVNTMWLNVVHLAVNLISDYFFIKYFGLPGALAAIVVTFLVIAPLKLWIIRGLLGGLFIPMSFLIRIFVPALLLAGLIYLVAPSPNLPMLFVLAFLYAGLFIVVLRVFRFIRPSDVHHFKGINLKGLNKVLDFLAGIPSETAHI